jgi:hypothetical protein
MDIWKYNIPQYKQNKQLSQYRHYFTLNTTLNVDISWEDFDLVILT